MHPASLEEIISATFSDVATAEKVMYPPVSAFPIGMLPGEEFAGSSESCSYLIEDQQYAVLIALFPELAEIPGMIETHASGPLHDRLEDNCGYVIGMLIQYTAHGLEVFRPPFVMEAAFRSIGEVS